ncbi:hypothetical protein C2E23DRAFT_861646 [Lenzites betulinus]|nr:hypothetical protein C2E23DRAFT_861646 [Lenzites betulinus]
MATAQNLKYPKNAYVKLEPIEIKPLRYIDVPKATRSTVDAFREDSYIKYFADADTAPFAELRDYLGAFSSLADAIHLVNVYSINGGDAILVIVDDVEAKRFGPLGSVIKPLLKACWTEELAKRHGEFFGKMIELLEAAFGDSYKDMIEIRSVATAPEKQGRGYAGALMRIAAEMGDAQGRGIYAVTTDAYKFYEAVGYTVVQEGTMGADNPSWSGPPIVVRVMYRAPEVAAGNPR